MRRVLHKSPPNTTAAGGGGGPPADEEAMLGKRGPRGLEAVRAAPATIWAAMTWPVLLTVAVIATTALIGASINGHYWSTNVGRLDDRIDADRAQLEEVGATLAALNASIEAVAADNEFFDDEWTLVNALDPTKQLRLNASLLTTSTPGDPPRNYALPDTDGVIALQETLPPPQTEFSEDVFAVLGALDPLKRVEFDLSLLGAAETRLYLWPNKNGVVALLEDVEHIVGNDTVFLDSLFGIENAVDTTKRAAFDASAISTNTNRTYGFPDLDGTLVLTTGFQEVSDKFLGLTNEVELFDDQFTLVSAGSRKRSSHGAEAQFDLDALGANATTFFALPGFGGTFLLTDGAQTVSDKFIDASNTIEAMDAQFTLVSSGNTTNATARFDLTHLNDSLVFELPPASGELVTLAQVQDVVTGRTVFPDSEFGIQNDPGSEHLAFFDATALTTANRTYAFPDHSSELALVDGPQTLSDKTLDNSNAATLLDANFTLQAAGDPSAELRFDLSPLAGGALRLATFPDRSGTVAYTTGPQTLGGTDLLPSNTYTARSDSFLVQDASAPTNAIAFDLSLLDEDQTRTFSWPDRDGTVAMLQDVVHIVGNDTVFLDSLFAIENDPDTTKRAAFDASQVVGNRTYTFPNLDGTLVLTDGGQTLSDKTLDVSSTIAVYDAQFTLSDDSNPTAEAQFDLDLIPSNTLRTYQLPDEDGVVALLATVEALISNDTEFSDALFAVFHGAEPSKVARFDASAIANATERTYGFPDLDGTLVLEDGAQTLSQKTLDATNVALLRDDRFELQAAADPSKTLVFDLSPMSGGAELTVEMPAFANSVTRVPLFTTGSQQVADKDLDNSNTAMLLDTQFTLQDDGDTSRQARFQLEQIASGETRTYTLADGSMSLVGQSGGTWNRLSLGMTDTTGTSDYEEVALGASSDKDRFFRFHTVGSGKSGVMYSRGSDFYSVAAAFDGLFFSYTDTLPTLHNELGDRVFGVDNTDKFLRLFNLGSNNQHVSLNTSVLTAGRVATFPDLDGTFVYEAGAQTLSDKTLDNSNLYETFDDRWTLLKDSDATARLRFDLDLIGSGVLRSYQWPNKDGVVALISDVEHIVGNDTVFLDSLFAIENAADTTRTAFFDASAISTQTNRTYAFPDADGTLVLEDSAQTLSNKQIDASNTVVKSALPADTVYETGTQTLSDKTIDGTNTVADSALSDNVVKRFGTDWDLRSLGLTTVGNITDFVTLPASSSINRFFRFRSAGSTRGRAGIQLSEFNNDNYFLFTAGGRYQITFTDSLPSTWDDLANAPQVFTIGGADKRTRLHQFSNDANYVEWDINALTAPRVLAAPDLAGTLALTAGAQTLSDKTLDNSNVYVAFDAQWTLQQTGDASAQAQFDLALVSGGTTHIYQLPNKGGVVALISDVEQLVESDNTFLDSVFAVENAADTTKRITFDASPIATGTNRTYAFPDTDMTIVGRSGSEWDTTSLDLDTSSAYNALLLSGDSSIDRFFRFVTGGGFPNGRAGVTFSFGSTHYHLFATGAELAIRYAGALPTTNDDLGTRALSIDNTNRRVHFHQSADDANSAEFDLSALTTARVLATPDLSGTLALTDGTQTLSDKTIDNSNTVDDGALSDNVVKRNGGNWDIISLGLSGGYSSINLGAGNGEDRFFRFRTGGSPSSRAGILLSEFSGAHWHFYAQGGLRITFNDSLPQDHGQLGDTVFQIENTNKHIRFYQYPTSNYVEWDVSALTSAHTLGVPNKSGTLALISDVQDLVESDNSFLDSVFTVENAADTTRRIKFDASAISTQTNRTYTYPDADGTLVLEALAQTLSNKELDASNTVAKGALPSDTVYESGAQTISDKTIDNSNTVADGALSDNVVKRNADEWDYVSLGMDNAVGEYNKLNLLSQDDRGRFFHFHSKRDGASGIVFSSGAGDGVPTADRAFHFSSESSGAFSIRYIGTTPGSYVNATESLGNQVLAIDGTNRHVQFYDHANNDKVAEFDPSGLTALREFAFPDLAGTFALTDGAQTLTDKTLDNTNTLTVLDTKFTLQDNGDPSRQAQFRLDEITGGQTRVFTLPDVNMDVVGRNGGTWNTDSLGLTTGSAYNAIQLQAGSSTDRFFRFRGGGSPTGNAGITLSLTTAHHYHLYTTGARFDIRYASSLPATNNDLGDRVFSIDNTNRRVHFHQSADDANEVEWDVDSLTTGRTLTVPNQSGTLALLSDVQDLVESDNSFLDSVFTVENAADTTKRIKFDASGIATQTNRTYAFPDTDMTLVGRNGDEWDYTSLNMSGGDHNYMWMRGEHLAHKRWMGFQTQGDGASGLIFGKDGGSAGYIFFRDNNNNGMEIFGHTALPTSNDVGDKMMGFVTNPNAIHVVAPFKFENAGVFSTIDQSGITADRTLTLPDLSGTLALTDGAQTLSDKTIDGTNAVADGALSDNVIRRSGGNFVLSSLGMGATTNVTEVIQLSASQDQNRFFRFRSGGGSPNGRAGIQLSAFDGDNFYLYAEIGGAFNIAHLGSLPSTYDDFDAASTIFSITGTKRIRFHQYPDSTNRVEWDLDSLTATRALTVPNQSGTIALLSDVQDAETGTVFLDSAFAVQSAADTTKQIHFDASAIATQTNRTYTFPDTDMGLVGMTSGASPAWDYASLGMATDVATNASAITLAGDAGVEINRFFQFTSAGNAAGYGGLLLGGVVDEEFVSPFSVTYALVVAENGLRLTKREEQGATLPEIPMVEQTIMSFRQDLMTLHKITDNSHSATFGVSALSGARTFFFPDKSGTLALLSDVSNADFAAEAYWRTQPWRFHDTPSNDNWEAIVWSPELELFVASSNGGGTLYSSDEGETWTASNGGGGLYNTDLAWTGAVFVRSGTEFEHGAGYKRAMISSDGISWTARDPGGPTSQGDSTAVGWSEDLGLIVMLWIQYPDWHPYVSVSDDNGTTWTTFRDDNNETNENDYSFITATAVIWVSDLQLFVAIGNWPEGAVKWASDPYDFWSYDKDAIPDPFVAVGLVWDPEAKRLLALDSNGGVATSSDAATWTVHDNTGFKFRSVAWIPELGLFMAGLDSSDTYSVATSRDGITWTGHYVDGSREWTALAWGAEIFRMAAVSNVGPDKRAMTWPHGDDIVYKTGAQTVDDKTFETSNTYEIDLNKATFHGDSGDSFVFDPVLPWNGQETLGIGDEGFGIPAGSRVLTVGNSDVRAAAFDDSSFAVYYSGTTANRMTFNMGDTGGAHDIRGPRHDGMMVVCQNSVSTRGIVFDAGGNSAFSTIQVPDQDGTMGLNHNSDYAFATMSSNQAASSGSSIKVNFDSEIADPGGNFDAVNNWYTAPITGLYHISYQLTSSSTTSGMFADFVHSFVGGGNEVIFRTRGLEVGGFSPQMTNSWMLEMDAGDRLHGRFRIDDSGASLQSGKLNSWFIIRPLGPV